MMIRYPNRLQWVILWATVLTAAWNWLGFEFTRFLYGYHGKWEWDGYLGQVLGRDARYHPTRLAFTILVLGLLLTWQASGWTRRKPSASAASSKTSGTTSPL